MIASDTRGKIVYATTDLATMLEYDPRKIRGLSIQKLIAQPFAQMHAKWMKVRSVSLYMV
jgi:hypothetical protein